MPSAPQPFDRASLTTAYAACERLAREHYENFPVASRILPARMRPHVAAVYAFARIADDLADEGECPAEQRQRQLDELGGQLHAQLGGGRTASPRVPETDLLFAALGNTIRECRLPVGPFDDLLSAFRQDTTKTRYASFEELLDYCRRSANPVGRLVLRIAGYDDARLDRASDSVCTALQLANFWQDLERDWERGRLYVPLDEMRQAGLCEHDLDARRLNAKWRSLMESLADRTWDLFSRGREVADLTRGRLRLELRLTWLGGCRILERLEARHFDVFGRRPALGAADIPLLLWRAAAWRFVDVRSPRSAVRNPASAAHRAGGA